LIGKSDASAGHLAGGHQQQDLFRTKRWCGGEFKVRLVSRPGEGCEVRFHMLLKQESLFKFRLHNNGISKIQRSEKHDSLPAKL